MSAIGFLASLGAGYLDGNRQKEKDDRQAKLDQITFDDADARKADRARENADRDALRAAAAPVPVEQTQLQGPPVDDATPMPSAYKVGANTFASQGAAQTAADTARTDRIATMLDSQNPGQASAYRNSIRQDKAGELALKSAVQKSNDEGTGRALSAALSGASPDQVKAIFNAQGEDKIGDIQITPIDVDHPVLGKQKSVKITGTYADGRPLNIPDALDSSFRLFSAEKQVDMLSKAGDKAETKRKDDADIKLKEAQADAIAGKAAGKTDKDPFAKMPEAAKLSYANLNDQAKQIDGAITKAQAEGSWDPNSPGAKALQVRRASIGIAQRKMLSDYTDDGDAAPTADPLKLNTPAAPTAGASVRDQARVSAPEQAARDVDAGKQMILNELGGDLSRVQPELARLDDAIKKAPSAEGKAALRGISARLKAGAMALQQKPAGMAMQGVQPAPGVQQAAPAAPPQQIPPPPPATMQQGLSTVANPVYAQWEAQFGDAWRSQQAQQASAGDAAALAARSYNPYQQNRVR